MRPRKTPEVERGLRGAQERSRRAALAAPAPAGEQQRQALMELQASVASTAALAVLPPSPSPPRPRRLFAACACGASTSGPHGLQCTSGAQASADSNEVQSSAAASALAAHCWYKSRVVAPSDAAAGAIVTPARARASSAPPSTE